jgi:hypothetical protein
MEGWRKRLIWNVRRTPEGGIAIRLKNKTGAVSIKGTIVSGSPTDTEAFRVAVANSPVPFGIVYESGIADGELCWVVIQGVAEILIKDGTSATLSNWVGVSDTAGRATALGHPGTVPPEADLHNREMGHCLETKAAGVNVLVKIITHFN